MDIQLQVLLVGDSCTDVYVEGEVNRLSPEAPVPVLSNITTTTKQGMSANVKDNLEALGCTVESVFNDPNLITKTRYIDKKSNTQFLRVDNEKDLPALEFANFELEKYDCIVISDYNKGSITYENIEYILDNYTGPVYIDTKKTDLVRLKNAYVKINSLENSCKETTCENLIVTMGKEGAIYKNKIYPAQEVEVSDVCGAGDTFLAALAYYHTLEGRIDDAIKFANRASSITVQHRGVYAPKLCVIK